MTFSTAGARASIKESHMQPTNAGKHCMTMTEIAPAAGRRDGIRATLKAAITGGAGFAVLVLLFLASAVYVVFGGTYEVTAAPEAGPSIAALAPKPADFGGSARNANESSANANAPDYFPAGYVNRGRDGDGNVMTYEHD